MTATERGGFSFLFASQKHKSGEQKSGKDDWRIHFSLHGGGVQEGGGHSGVEWIPTAKRPWCCERPGGYSSLKLPGCVSMKVMDLVCFWLQVSEVSGHVSTQNGSQICPYTPFGGFL